LHNHGHEAAGDGTGREHRVSGEADRATFRDVFTVPEFQALWLAQVLSVAGDQVARVALTLLVYDRTRSAVLAAITFVMGMLPAFVGGILLSGLGDRLPRRAVMIGCDLVRAALVVIMTVPGLPLAALVGLLFVVTAGSVPFISARSAVYPEILSGSRYVTATAVTLTTSQAAQVVGFAAGGTIAGGLGVRVSLSIDAATFIASALLVGFGTTARPAPRASPDQSVRARRFPAPTGGIRLVFSNPALRTPMLLAWLAAFYNAPEGVATPFAHQLSGGPATVGLLLAAPALGYALAALAFGRLAHPAVQERLMSALPLACCALLLPIALHPPLAVTLLILTASGACACFQVAANATFVAAAPAHQRSQATGLAIAGLTLGQGLAMIVAGAAAQRFTPATVIATAGALGAVAAGILGIQHRAQLSARDAPPPSSAPG
jgi:MFS family permease